MPRPTSRPRRSKPASPPPPYHHGDLAYALKEAALALIDEVGPDGFTLREVARRIGVSHAAPYRHFRDKRALMTALAAEGSARLGARIAAALDGAGADLRARFLAAGHAYVCFAVEERARFRVTFFATDVDVADPAIVAGRAASFGLLVGFIREAQRARFFSRKEDPAGLATTIWAMHHGLASLASVGGLDKMPGDLRTISDLAHGKLLDGLTPRVRR